VKVSFEITSGEVAAITNGKILSGSTDVNIKTITSDSRELGEDNLFIPIKGENFDGHDFIAPLFDEKKILCSLTMADGFEESAEKNGATLIRCDDTLCALGRLGRFNRMKYSPFIVGVTGTNGKTTTKELIAEVLSVKYKTLKNKKNYNNEIGVPFTLLEMDKSHEAAVIEMGMNHRGEVERLSKMVMPEIGVITSIGAGHLEFLGTVENVARAKSEIVSGMKKDSLLLVNGDTECLNIVHELAVSAELKVLTYGLNQRCNFKPESYKMTQAGVSLVYSGIDFFVPLYGKHNLYNLLAAIAIADLVGISLSEVKERLASFENVAGRSEIIDRGFIVINDTYNSNPLSSLYALESLCEVFPSRRKIAVLADMKELGELAPLYHIKVGEFVAARNFKELLLFGDMAQYYQKGALSAGMKADKIMIFDDKMALALYLREKLTERDVVLVKGSRSMKMEDVVQRLIS